MGAYDVVQVLQLLRDFGRGLAHFFPHALVALQQLHGDPSGTIPMLQNAPLRQQGFHFSDHRVKIRAVADAQGFAPGVLPPEGDGGRHDFLQTLAGAGHGFPHRNAETPPEHFAVDVHPGPARLVHHVQGQGHGDAHFQDLHGEQQVALKRRGVHHVHHGQRRLAREHLAGDDLFGGIGRQRIGSGQVHKGHFRIVQPEDALFLFHGHAGVVAHMLARAGIGVECRGLARIGIAGQGDARLALVQGDHAAAFPLAGRSFGMQFACLTHAQFTSTGM